MNTSGTQLEDTHEDLIERLKSSAFYQICQNAFREATDLPLVISDISDNHFNPCHASPNQNLFCQRLNSLHGSCVHCVNEQEYLLSKTTEKAFTHTCFVGLKETAVPLRLGHNTIGFLKTGQVFTDTPTAKQRGALSAQLDSSGYAIEEIEKVLENYKQTPVIEEEKYSSMVTLLSVISLQLTEFLNRLLLESKTNEPDIVRKAKEIIADRIDEKILLKDISNEVNVSVFYFCKIFKQATSMTFTEYVNRQRIELAKAELMNSDKPITEIAYAVGFQSLSQFNRCFLKYAGESPRQYRQHIRKASNQFLVR